MKVLFTANLPLPYAVDFFCELGKKCDLTILFTNKYQNDKVLRQYAFENFTCVFLRGKSLGGRRDSFCPEIVDYIKPGIYDRILIGNPLSSTGMLAVKHMQIKKLPYWVVEAGAFSGKSDGIKMQLKASVYNGAQICLSTCNNHDAYYLSYGVNKNNIRRYPFSSLHNFHLNFLFCKLLNQFLCFFPS